MLLPPFGRKEARVHPRNHLATTSSGIPLIDLILREARVPSAGAMDDDALFASLRDAAAAAQLQTLAALREASVHRARCVQCVYLGQRVSGAEGKHEASPVRWTVPSGERRSQTLVDFRWCLPGREQHAQTAPA